MNSGQNSIDGVDFTVEVLTNGNWPIEEEPKCNIPKPLARCQTKFNLFYKNKHQNRQLKWLFQHGTVELKALFAAKPYQFIVNTFQATILEIFDTCDSMTYAQIKEKTAIPEKQLSVALVNLANPKNGKLLLKEVQKPIFSPNEKVTLNLKFANN